MRLAVFMDGTWSDPADGTNIDQLCGRAPESDREAGGGGQDKQYIEGVGNRPWERLRGGVLGRGVDANIRKGYEFIAAHHRPGDQIFLFGYSRGAFTARSLAGMIAKCGVVPPEVLGAEELFDRYRDRARPGLREMLADEDDHSRRTEQDRAVLANGRLERIRFIGVFDTVGSLGIPGSVGRLFARKYQFHDTNLSGYVDFARHAVAIDENRPEFQPTLWTGVPVPIAGSTTSIEQRWFVGAHSDVGGGGPRSRARAPLSALAREWMADEAENAGLDLRAAQPPLTGDEWESPYDDPFASWLRPVGWLVPGRRPHLRPVNTSTKEELDESVLRRWASSLGYRPRNPHLTPWVRTLLAGAGGTPVRTPTPAVRSNGSSTSP
jgi:uncharacterized protein (DUF2235 family)